MLADENSSFVRLLLVTYPFVLVTKSWKVTDPQWEAALSGYLPLQCTEEHYRGKYRVSEQRNPLNQGVEFVDQFMVTCRISQDSFYTDDFLMSLPCVSQSCCKSASLFLTFLHCAGYLFHYGIVFISGCGILRQTGCCTQLDRGFSRGRVVSAAFPSERGRWSAAPAALCRPRSYPHSQLRPGQDGTGLLLRELVVLHRQAGVVQLHASSQVFKLVLRVSCFWFWWSTEYLIGLRMGEQL